METFVIDFAAAERDVHDRDDLVQLIRQLSEDFQQHSDSWENITVDGFLEALSAWLADADGLYRNLNKEFSTQPTWAFFAEMLLGARLYE